MDGRFPNPSIAAFMVISIFDFHILSEMINSLFGTSLSGYHDRTELNIMVFRNPDVSISQLSFMLLILFGKLSLMVA